MAELNDIDSKIRDFLTINYGSVAVFEHGIFGQTVFHSHIHYLPFKGKPSDIVPEGNNELTPLIDFDQLKTILKKDGGYLFMSIGPNMWTVNPKLQAPRFFRDRFAIATGKPELGNWKAMRGNDQLIEQAKITCLATQKKWQKYYNNI